MDSTLTVSAPSGRIWHRQPQPGQNALVLTVDFTVAQALPVHARQLHLDAQGTALHTTDSRGNVSEFLFTNNRYTQSVRAGGTPSAFIVLPGGKGYLIGVNNTIEVFSTGKKVFSANAHQRPIKGFSANYRKQWVLSYSSDKAVVWDWGNWLKVREIGTKGVGFAKVQFSPDGQSLLTCFDDGKLYRWGLWTNDMEQLYAFSDVKDFCVSQDGQWVYGADRAGGISVWRGSTNKKDCFLPFKGVKSLHLWAGYLFVVGDNQAVHCIDREKFRIVGELNRAVLQVGLEGEYMACLLANGKVELYEIKPLLQNWEREAQRKSALGLEAYELIHPVHCEDTLVTPTVERQMPLTSNEDILFSKLLEEKSTSSYTSSAVQNQPCQHEIFKKIFEKAKLDPHESKIQHCYLRKVLHAMGEYPEKYRALIWRFQLQLPNNRAAFTGLVSKGTHPSFAGLFIEFPSATHKQFAKTEKVASALAYWAPLLGEVEYVPKLVFPFTFTFEGDELSCFEAVMAILLHWLQHWFEFHPSPPIVVTQSIENIVKKTHSQLFKKVHELCCGETVGVYWELVKSLLFAVMEVGDWLRYMDFIVTDWDKPELLLYSVAAYVIYYGKRILQFSKKKELTTFLSKKRPLKVKKFMKLVFSLHEDTGNSTSIVNYATKLPISEKNYPLFTAYPKYTVQTAEEEALQIQQDLQQEAEALATTKELERLRNTLPQREAEFQAALQSTYHDQAAKLVLLKQEQAARQEALQGLNESSKQTRLEQIKSLEASNNDFLQSHAQQRKALVNSIYAGLSEAACLSKGHQQVLKENEGLNALEFSATNKLLDLLQQQKQEEETIKSEFLNQHKNSELSLKDEILKQQWMLQDQQREIQRLQAAAQRQEEQELAKHQKTLTDKESAQRHLELEREMKILQLESERKLRQLAEDELLRNAEFSALHTTRLQLLQQREQAELSQLQCLENEHERGRAEQRLQAISEELRKTMQERLQVEGKQLEENHVKYTKELHLKFNSVKNQYQAKTVKEEKEFENEVLKLEEDRRTQKRLEQELQFKGQELREKDAFEEVLRETEKLPKSEVKRKLKKELENYQGDRESLSSWEERKSAREQAIRDKNASLRQEIQSSLYSSESSQVSGQRPSEDSASFCSTCGEQLEASGSECSCSVYSEISSQPTDSELSSHPEESLSLSRSEHSEQFAHRTAPHY